MEKIYKTEALNYKTMMHYADILTYQLAYLLI